MENGLILFSIFQNLIWQIKYFAKAPIGELGFCSDFLRVIFPIYTLTYQIILLTLLRKAISQCSKKFIRWFLMAKSVFYIPFLTLYVLLNIHGPLPQTKWTNMATWIFIALLTLFTIYTIFIVHVNFKKLESPIMTILHEHCNHLEELEESESVNDIDLLETPDLNTTTRKLFSNYILSPLDITTDTSCILGEGMFGTVYKGILLFKNEKVQIAAKVAKDVENPDAIEMILKEVKIQIHAGAHDNIVTFYGVTSDASFKDHIAVVTEFCSLGSLDDFLLGIENTVMENVIGKAGEQSVSNTHTVVITHGPRENALKVFTRFATDIAKGMEHLVSKRIIHGDLAARNVLVSGDLKAKITDFGMSRRLYAYEVYSKTQDQKGLLPWRWMSIEAIEDFSLSEKSDVWSYGVTLWEIFTFGDFPYNDVDWSLDVLKQIKKGLLKLEKPNLASDEIYNIMQQCWEIDKLNRPTFEDLKFKFEELLVAIYAQL